MKYVIIFEIYDTLSKPIKHTFDDWNEALRLYHSLNESIPNNWTRHNSCLSEISHMDRKMNLFNEGSLTLKPL